MMDCFCHGIVPMSKFGMPGGYFIIYEEPAILASFTLHYLTETLELYDL